MPNKIILNIQNVHQWFKDGKNFNNVLYDLNIQIAQGQFVSLVGPSGSGKSTLLKAILGTHPPKEGFVEVDGKKVLGPNRNVGIVYQQYSLYPFWTAEQNAATGPKWDQTGLFTRFFRPWAWWPMRRRHVKEARELLTKFKLGDAFNRYPEELSGGMQQRVAIAQSLIMRPKVLLLDEPFGALDEFTRSGLQKEILKLYAENLEAKKRGQDAPWTVVCVTHELKEAFYISDRVIGLSRNWHEDTQSGRITGANLGATKVWDKCAPTYTPDDPKDFDRFYLAEKEITDSVLNDMVPSVERNLHVSFWDDLMNGVGTGVSMIRSE